MEIKLIIWDLDDTLWQGTLAEGDALCLHETRAALIRDCNRHGIVSAICSKNDFALAKKALEQFALWDELVFPRIAFTPKGAVIQAMIADMQLRPVNVLFVDDNPHNLQEVKALVPEIHLLDARSSECDLVLQQILQANQHVNKSRVNDYRLLQARVEDRQRQPVSNDAFLRLSDIHITYSITLENLEFKDRILELINRSNQLNYTRSRVDAETLTAMMLQNTRYDSWAVYVWDKYGYYGLVGFAMIERESKKLLHFVFSCRIMHMGVEQATLQKISERYPAPDRSSFILTMPALTMDWLTEDKYLSPDIRSMIRAKEHAVRDQEAQIKILYGCMSGGIAFYSKHRDVMDCDGARFEQDQRFLCFSNLRCHPEAVAEQLFPRALVYGAAFDYYNSAWEPTALPLENKSFVNGLFTFCQFFANKNHRLLVVLPPENLPLACYRPRDGSTRERTMAFNKAWRDISRFFAFISILDLSEMATADDMCDAAHYTAAFMQTVAERIDHWYDTVCLSLEAVPSSV